MPCSRAQVQLLFLYLTGSPAQCCKSSTGLSHPAPINNTRKTSHTDLSAGRFDAGIFSAEVLASNVTLVCVKLEHTLGQVTMVLLDRLTQTPGPGMAQLFGHLVASSRAPDMTGDCRGHCLPSRTRPQDTIADTTAHIRNGRNQTRTEPGNLIPDGALSRG